MWRTLKFRVIGVVCTIALVVAMLPILVAAPFGLLSWLIKALGLTLVRLGLWLQGLLDAYLTGWGQLSGGLTK
jgi:small-conductance mechanosensitive channel